MRPAGNELMLGLEAEPCRSLSRARAVRAVVRTARGDARGDAEQQERQKERRGVSHGEFLEEGKEGVNGRRG